MATQQATPIKMRPDFQTGFITISRVERIREGIMGRKKHHE